MSRYAIRSSLAALGLIVATAGLSGTAIAAPDSVSATAPITQHEGKRGDHPRGHGKHGGHRGDAAMRDAFMVPGVGPISKEQVQALKLDAKQQAAFDSAKQSQGEMFKAMRENGGKRHELLAKQLKDDKLDPRALIADQEAQRAEMHKQSEQLRGKWLAAWDSLNSTQKQQVTELVKERQAKIQAHRAKHQAERRDKSAATPSS